MATHRHYKKLWGLGFRKIAVPTNRSFREPEVATDKSSTGTEPHHEIGSHENIPLDLKEQEQNHNAAQSGDIPGQGRSPNSLAYVRSHLYLQTVSVSNRCLTFSGPVTDPDMLCHLRAGTQAGERTDSNRFDASRALAAYGAYSRI